MTDSLWASNTSALDDRDDSTNPTRLNRFGYSKCNGNERIVCVALFVIGARNGLSHARGCATAALDDRDTTLKFGCKIVEQKRAFVLLLSVFFFWTTLGFARLLLWLLLRQHLPHLRVCCLLLMSVRRFCGVFLRVRELPTAAVVGILRVQVLSPYHFFFFLPAFATFPRGA